MATGRITLHNKAKPEERKSANHFSSDMSELEKGEELVKCLNYKNEKHKIKGI
jgi:hypothetical protein